MFDLFKSDIYLSLWPVNVAAVILVVVDIAYVAALGRDCSCISAADRCSLCASVCL